MIGMPGSGKSTVGRLLAERLKFRFIDLDNFIKEAEKKSHAEIAKEKGDSELMRLEELYTLNLDLEDTVFSPGGSLVYSRPAMRRLMKDTLVVHLDVPCEEIEKRIGDKAASRGIVGFAEKGLVGVFRERHPLYQANAHIALNCRGLDVSATVAGVHDIYKING